MKFTALMLLWLFISCSSCFAGDVTAFEALNEQGIDLYQAGKLSEAESVLRKALGTAQQLHASHKQEIPILNNLAVVLEAERKYDEAAKVKALIHLMESPAAQRQTTKLTLPPGDRESRYSFGRQEEEENYTAAARRDQRKEFSIQQIFAPATPEEVDGSTYKHWTDWNRNTGYVSHTTRGREQAYEQTCKYLSESYHVSASALISTLKSGGHLIELSEGYLLSTTEDLDENVWRTGAKVHLSQHGLLRLPALIMDQDTYDGEQSISVRLLAKH